MRSKVVTVSEAVDHIKDGMTLMIGGFMAVGTPESLVDEIVKRGIKDLTVIANDTGSPGRGISKLVAARCVKKVIASHIGLNPETGQLMFSGEMEVELVPQGTLIERIRAKGAGLGGFLTPTGVGTEVAEGKQTMTIDGVEYLLELPIHADVALVGCAKADINGNVVFLGTTRNFNQCSATAADTVIVEAEEIVEFGQINPNDVVVPGLFVDYLVGGEK